MATHLDMVRAASLNVDNAREQLTVLQLALLGMDLSQEDKRALVSLCYDTEELLSAAIPTLNRVSSAMLKMEEGR